MWKLLWNDDAGAILSSEYAMLFAVVVVGTTAGMSSIRDSINESLTRVGNDIATISKSNASLLPLTKLNRPRNDNQPSADAIPLTRCP